MIPDRGRFCPWFLLALASLLSVSEALNSDVHNDLLDWFQASDVQAALRQLPTSRLETLPTNLRDLLLDAQNQQQGGQHHATYRFLAEQVDQVGNTLDAGHVQHDSSAGGHEGPHAHEAIAYLVVVLVCGIATFHMLSRVHSCPIPYTVALFFEGQLIGIIHNGLDKNHWDTLSHSIEMWVNIDYHVLLYTFLPCLLFGDTLGLNWCLWKQCFSQCFLLAGPGVVMGAGLTALVGRFILPYGWDWSTCLTFGSIMAATDPVAVVGLLKELGAAKALTMQISGEALLNDGFAIVAWTVCFKAMVGETISAHEVVLKFVQLAVGGVGAGWLMGSILLSWLLRASNKMQEADHVIQISLTITCAYFTFFFAENDLHFSGVLAVVFGAVCVSRAAWPLFTDHKGLVVVWHTIEFLGNTIVFVLAGTITGGIMGDMALADYGWLLVTYSAAIIIRGAMVMLLYPILKRLGPGCNWKDAFIMTWGGLRGAVGLALAIAVANNEAVDKQVGKQVAFHVSGLASLTLLLNATTCAPLLKALGMTNKHIAHLEMVDGLRATLKSITKWSYIALSTTEKFQQHDKEALRTFVSCLQDLNAEQEEADRAALGQQLQQRVTKDNKSVQRVARVMSFTSVTSDDIQQQMKNESKSKQLGFTARGSVDIGLSQIQRLARTIQCNPVSLDDEEGEDGGDEDDDNHEDSGASTSDPGSPKQCPDDESDGGLVDVDDEDLVLPGKTAKDNGTNVHVAVNGTGHPKSKQGTQSTVSNDFARTTSMTSKASANFARTTSITSKVSETFHAVQTVGSMISRGSQESRLSLPLPMLGGARRRSQQSGRSSIAESYASQASAVSSAVSADGTNSARMAAGDVMQLIKDVTNPSKKERDWVLEDSDEWARACLYLPTERDLFLSVLQATYWKFIDDGLLPSQSQATSGVLRSVDYARMYTDGPLADGEALLKNLMCGHQRSIPFIGWVQNFGKRVLDGDNIGFMIVPCRRGKYHVFDLFALVSFMDAHEMCRKKMKDFKCEKDTDLWNARMTVLQESKYEERVIQEFLEDNMIGANMVERVRTKQMAFQLLLQQEHKVGEWLNLGAIDCTDAEDLLHSVKLDHAKLLKPWRDVVTTPSKPQLFNARTSVNLNQDLQIQSIINLQRSEMLKMTQDRQSNRTDAGGQGSVRLKAYSAVGGGGGERRSASKGATRGSGAVEKTISMNSTNSHGSRRTSKEPVYGSRRASKERRKSHEGSGSRKGSKEKMRQANGSESSTQFDNVTAITVVPAEDLNTKVVPVEDLTMKIVPTEDLT